MAESVNKFDMISEIALDGRCPLPRPHVIVCSKCNSEYVSTYKRTATCKIAMHLKSTHKIEWKSKFYCNEGVNCPAYKKRPAGSWTLNGGILELSNKTTVSFHDLNHWPTLPLHKTTVIFPVESEPPVELDERSQFAARIRRYRFENRISQETFCKMASTDSKKITKTTLAMIEQESLKSWSEKRYNDWVLFLNAFIEHEGNRTKDQEVLTDVQIDRHPSPTISLPPPPLIENSQVDIHDVLENEEYDVLNDEQESETQSDRLVSEHEEKEEVACINTTGNELNNHDLDASILSSLISANLFNQDIEFEEFPETEASLIDGDEEIADSTVIELVVSACEKMPLNPNAEHFKPLAKHTVVEPVYSDNEEDTSEKATKLNNEAEAEESSDLEIVDEVTGEGFVDEDEEETDVYECSVNKRSEQNKPLESSLDPEHGGEQLIRYCEFIGLDDTCDSILERDLILGELSQMVTTAKANAVRSETDNNQMIDLSACKELVTTCDNDFEELGCADDFSQQACNELFEWQKEVLSKIDGSLGGLEEADRLFFEHCDSKIKMRNGNKRAPPPVHQKKKFTEKQKSRYLRRIWRQGHKKKAMSIIRGEADGEQLAIPPEQIEEYYSNLLSNSSHVSPEELKIKRAVNEPIEEDISCWEVKESLRKCGKSAPGPDGITFFDIKVFDRKGMVLAAIFNSAMQLRMIPHRWKKSVTTLIPKNGSGDKLDLDNRRPITCQQTIHKVYTGIIAARFEQWCSEQGLISEEQTGFKRQVNGCMRNTFVASEVIRAGGHAMFADISKAFNTIPHDHIMRVLCDSGAGYLQEVILDFYVNVSTKFRTGGGLTLDVPVKAGILQGCRLSPILFNLCIQPAIDALNEHRDLGFAVDEEKRCSVAFADDFCIISRTRTGLQQLSDVFNKTIGAIGLKLNFAKCFSTKARNKKSKPIAIEGKEIMEIDDEDIRKYLGSPVPFCDTVKFTNLLKSVLDDTKAIDKCYLLPWQKIECLNTFVLSRLPFYLQVIGHTKGELDKVDRAVRQKVKKWLGIDSKSANLLCYLSRKEGGAGTTPLVVLDAVSKLTTALQMLNCNDTFVRNLARTTLKKACKKTTASNADEKALNFLNKESKHGNLGLNFWSQVAKSSAVINIESNDLKIVWLLEEDEFKLKLVRGQFEEKYGISNIRVAYREIKNQLRTAWLHLVENKSCTWAYKTIARHPCSNNPIIGNDSMGLSDYFFVQKARTHTLHTRARQNLFSRVEDTSCRHCNLGYENVYHALNGCDSNLIKAEYMRRHNKVCKVLVDEARTLAATTVKINEDCIPALSTEIRRPDILIVDKSKKTAIFIDVNVCIDKMTTMVRNERHRHVRYNQLKLDYTERGYETKILGYIVGSCGSYYDRNDLALKSIGVQPRDFEKVRVKSVVAAIKGSNEVWKAFVTGRQQGKVKRDWNHTSRDYDKFFYLQNFNVLYDNINSNRRVTQEA